MGVYAVVLAEPISDTIAAVTTTIMVKIKSCCKVLTVCLDIHNILK